LPALALWLLACGVGLTVTYSDCIKPAAGILGNRVEQIAASGDAKAIWAFAVRNSGSPESELAHSKLVGLIDATVDIPTLQVLRLVAADAIAERARERLLHLEAWASAKPNGVATAAPSSDPPASQSTAAKEVKPEEALAQAAEDRTIKEAKREEPRCKCPSAR